MALACKGLTVRHRGADAVALDGVDCVLERGRVLGVAGACGSGKSTLARCLAGSLADWEGTVTLESAAVAPDELRASCGLLFQNPECQLFAATALEDVCFGPRCAGRSDGEAEAAAVRALEAVGLDVERARVEAPGHYSGGEQRRLALAGVLALDAPYLVLDEPCAGLDPGQREQLGCIVRGLAQAGKGVMVVAHDLDFLGAAADEVLVLAGGRVAARGPAARVLGDADALRSAGLRPSPLVALAERLRIAGIAETTAASAVDGPAAFAAALADGMRETR